MKISQMLAALAILGGAVTCLFVIQFEGQASGQDGEAKAQLQEATSASAKGDTKQDLSLQDQFVPVDNMHHFMEYVCEPSYKSLKQIMTKEPENRSEWKAFKNHALVLAESSALVSMRGPDDPEKSKKWKELSLSVYSSGAALYKASGNFEEAKKHYGLMIDNCNQCHTDFAEGKHQLKK